MQTLRISGMGVVGLKYGLKDRQVEMERGLGGCSPCREAVQWGHVENVLSLSWVTGVSPVGWK